MSVSHPHLAAYQRSSVTTSDRVLIIRLHDKMLSELAAARQEYETTNLPTMRPHVQRIQDIIAYLRGCLDPDVELSPTMASLYSYYLVCLAHLYTQPTADAFADMEQHLIEWRDTWVKSARNRE